MATFLERIAASRPFSREDIGEARDSVIRHLQKLLNTRQGNVALHPDYGIPDLTEFIYSFPESIPTIQNVIASVIEQYEPRLKSVRVSYRESPDDLLTIKFDITAQLVMPDQSRPGTCRFETTIGSTGHIKVEG